MRNVRDNSIQERRTQGADSMGESPAVGLNLNENVKSEQRLEEESGMIAHSYESVPWKLKQKDG